MDSIESFVFKSHALHIPSRGFLQRYRYPIGVVTWDGAHLPFKSESILLSPNNDVDIKHAK